MPNTISSSSFTTTSTTTTSSSTTPQTPNSKVKQWLIRRHHHHLNSPPSAKSLGQHTQQHEDKDKDKPEPEPEPEPEDGKESESESESLSTSYTAYYQAFTSPIHTGPHRQTNHDSTTETETTTLTSAGDVSVHDEIRFLPLGAYGYEPAPWVRPRLQGPEPELPEGSMTPSRYEEIQRRGNKNKDGDGDGDGMGKRQRRLNWWTPIRGFWVSLGRSRGRA